MINVHLYANMPELSKDYFPSAHLQSLESQVNLGDNTFFLFCSRTYKCTLPHTAAGAETNFGRIIIWKIHAEMTRRKMLLPV